jgi:hypothetical protein
MQHRSTNVSTDGTPSSVVGQSSPSRASVGGGGGEMACGGSARSSLFALVCACGITNRGGRGGGDELSEDATCARSSAAHAGHSSSAHAPSPVRNMIWKRARAVSSGACGEGQVEQTHVSACVVLEHRWWRLYRRRRCARRGAWMRGGRASASVFGRARRPLRWCLVPSS